MSLPVARVAHVSWWRRLLARFSVVHWPSEMRDLNELADERVRLALSRQLSDLLDHIHDRDLEIRLLRDQVRELVECRGGCKPKPIAMAVVVDKPSVIERALEWLRGVFR